MKNPFFSIVIPTYNRVNLLSKAIDSVFAQTYADWELVIVDDGSTDSTRELVYGYCKKDPRIHYLYQDNAERSLARNNGIDNAIGEFICFLDSDDYYAPNRLENISTYLKNQSNIKSFYYTAITYDYGIKLEERPERKRQPDENVFEFIVQAIIGTPQVIIARDFLIKERFDPRWRIGEDMELWLRLAKIEEPKYIPNEASVIATEHEDRSVNLKRFNSGFEQLTLLKNIFNSNHSGNLISARIKRNTKSNCYFTIFKFWFYKQNRLQCLRYIILCIVTNIQSEQLKFRLNLLIRIFTFQSYDRINKLLE